MLLAGPFSTAGLPGGGGSIRQLGARDERLPDSCRASVLTADSWGATAGGAAAAGGWGPIDSLLSGMDTTDQAFSALRSAPNTRLEPGARNTGLHWLAACANVR